MSKGRLLCSAITLTAAMGLTWAVNPPTATVPIGEDFPAPVTRPATQYLEKSTLSNDVSLSLKMPKKAAAGEILEVELTIENKSDKDILNGFEHSYDCDFVLKVIDDVYKPVPYTRYGQFRKPSQPVRDFVAYRNVRIHPGQSHSVIVNLGLLFDITVPGRYALEAQKIVNRGMPSQVEVKLDNCEFYISRPPVRQRLPEEPNAAASRPKG